MPGDLLTIHLTTQLFVVSATLCVLLWVAITQNEKAGLWWFACGFGIMSDGLVSAFASAPAWLLLIVGDAAGPLVAYFFYRGVAEYLDRPPDVRATLLVVGATAVWIGLLPIYSELSLYVAMAAQVPLICASALLFWRQRTTPIRTLLACGCFALMLFVAAGPWIRESSNAHGPRAMETEFWLLALVPILLVLVCALLDRNLIKARDALEEKAQLLSIAAAQAGLGTWTCDPQTNALDWSDEMWAISRLDRNNTPSPSRLKSTLVDPDSWSEVREQVRRALREDEPLHIDTPIRLPTGEHRIISARAQAITRHDGERLVVGSALDVTDQRNAIEELERYRNHLEDVVEQRTEALHQSRQQLLNSERLASLGTLTAGLAHQVNNPIGAIRAAADFARRCEGDADELEVLRRAVGDIESEATRCGAIVRGMLQFASAQPSERIPVRIDDILAELTRTLAISAHRYEATLEFRAPGPGPVVSVCRLEIEQALTNIIINAFQSRASGVAVKLIRKRVGRNVLIEVEDNGPGIRSESLERILEPFYTSRIGEGGTGLGLSIAHGVAQTHGGNLTIASEVGVGTIAKLTLPIIDGKRFDPPSEDGSRRPSSDLERRSRPGDFPLP